MPPGPAGVPVLGNLLQMMEARRRGALSVNKWVSVNLSNRPNVLCELTSGSWPP